MENVSYFREGASCLPFVGPFIAIYNAREVKQEMGSHSLFDTLNDAINGLNDLEETLADLAGNPEKAATARQRQADRRTADRNKYLPVNQKGRVYSICGIVGNVLSVAIVVGLTALEILSVKFGVLATASFTAQAAFLIYDLYQHNKKIKLLQESV